MVVMTSAAFRPSRSIPINDDCVAGTGVVQEVGQARSLLSRRHSRQLVAVDPLRVDTRCGEGVELLVQRLVAGADTCVSELSARGSGSGCGHDISMSQKSQKHKIATILLRQLLRRVDVCFLHP